MQQYKIIILDDDLDEILLLRDCFQRKGVECVKYFTDGAQCMEYLEACTAEELPNVVITDLNMPRITGYDLLKWIKARERYNDIPVVVYSTSNLERYIEICLEMGAREYLVKPKLISEYDHLASRINEFAFI